MTYTMKFNVDGGCRGNGQTNPIGAAAAISFLRWGNKYRHRTRQLGARDISGQPIAATNQRAEITAIMLALEWALERYQELHSSPRLFVTICADSEYAVKSMTQWFVNWESNGWMNSRGQPVANQDLLRQALLLKKSVARLGRVRFKWVPREQNAVADRHCNDELDDMER